MQPYFFPYAGYFRLFAAADQFVIFDCVQFPRRGRVHRTEVPGANGAPEWLTLPLAYHPRDVFIRDLRFARDARERFDRCLAGLPWIRSAAGPSAERVRAFLATPLDSVIDYLVTGLRLVVDLLGFQTSIIRSSSLDLNPSLRGQARVIAAVQAVGGACYLNPPGGRALYDAATFRHAGLELAFLTPYGGRYVHLLPAVMMQPAEDICRDVHATCGVAAD